MTNPTPSADLMEPLTAIFRETFDDAGIVISAATTARDIDGWDSLSNIELIVAIEAEFGVRFSSAEIADLSNVGDLMDLITRKRQA